MIILWISALWIRDGPAIREAQYNESPDAHGLGS
jgi:hypothetical protein